MSSSLGTGSSWISAHHSGGMTHHEPSTNGHINGKSLPGESIYIPTHTDTTKAILRSSNIHILTHDNCAYIIQKVLPFIELPSHVLNNLDSWELDIFTLTNYELIILCTKIMDTYHFFDTYPISLDKWFLLLLNVEYRMVSNKNPYHNFVHVIDVFQSCHIFLSKFDGKCLLQPIDIFSIFISALTHDLDHPGLNNTYQINALTPLAIRYNDVSVLENYHCSQAFELLYHPQINLLEGFDADSMKYVRKAIIKAILSTDMVHHFAIKSDFESTLASKATILASIHSENTSNMNNSNSCMTPSHLVSGAQTKRAQQSTGGFSSARRGSFTPSTAPAAPQENAMTSTASSSSSSGPNPKRIHLSHNQIIPSRVSFSAAGETFLTEKERLLWISLVVHAADIGNPAKPWHLSKRWSDNVFTEFLQQGDREKVENLPVSMNCDRDVASQDEVSLNFIDFIIAPFFISFAKILPKFRVLCGYLHENRQRWHDAVIARISHLPGAEEQLAKWNSKLEQSRESLEPYVDKVDK